METISIAIIGEEKVIQSINEFAKQEGVRFTNPVTIGGEESFLNSPLDINQWVELLKTISLIITAENSTVSIVKGIIKIVNGFKATIELRNAKTGKLIATIKPESDENEIATQIDKQK